MRIVVTGSSGFIGSALVEKLLEANAKVCILIRPDSRLKNWRINHPEINVLTYTSLADAGLLMRLKEWQPKIMVNLAWKGVGSDDRCQADQFINNIPNTLESVNLAAKAGCTQWIGIGSQAEYGIHNSQISEDVTCRPIGAYGKAKFAAGIASLGMCDSLNIIGTWARIFSVYGPGDHMQTFINYIITSFCNKQTPVLTACTQNWDYLFIDDAASAIIALIQNKCKGVFNIGSGDIIVLKDIVNHLKEILQFKGQLLFGEKEYDLPQITHLQADIQKLKKQTNWQPSVSLQQGLKQTILSLKKV